MHTLNPFQPTEISLQGEFTRSGRELTFRYSLQDPKAEVLDGLRPSPVGGWTRANELWKTTCFEAFWGMPGESKYWELNLSPSKQAWNLYVFKGYREPQPPSPAFDCELVKVEMTPTTLEATLKSALNLKTMELSLTAIIRTLSGVNYFALKHSSPQADFHSRDSFILKA